MWQPGWDGSLGENGSRIYMAESPHCSPETITLLTGYTPIQNKKVLKKEKNKTIHLT